MVIPSWPLNFLPKGQFDFLVHLYGKNVEKPQITSLKPMGQFLPNFSWIFVDVWDVYQKNDKLHSLWLWFIIGLLLLIISKFALWSYVLFFSILDLKAIFSWAGQSPGRAIALPPASPSEPTSTFAMKFLRAHIFHTVWWIWFIFGVMIDVDPNIYSALTPPTPVALKSRSFT